VPSGRTISTTAPLTGGGTLAANLTFGIASATTTNTGVVELATLLEADAQTDATLAVTPAGLVNRVFTSRTISTVAPLTGGGDLTANRTLSVSAATDIATGVVELATPAEVVTGSDTVKAVTPAGAAGAFVGKASYSAKGNVLVGTGAGTFVNLGVGTDTQVLTADSTQASGVRWGTPAGGATILTMRQTADVTNATVTPVAATGLVFTYAANSFYQIDYTVYCTSVATTTGYAFTLDTSTAPGTSGVHLFFSHGLAATGTSTSGYSVGDNGATVVGVSSGVPVAAQDVPVTVSAQFHSGATGGTAQLMFRPEVAASATIKAGSIGRALLVP
jgi:hypothetical protein